MTPPRTNDHVCHISDHQNRFQGFGKNTFQKSACRIRDSVVDIFEKKLLCLFQLFVLLSVRQSYQEFRSLKSKSYNIPQMSTIFRLMAILEYYCSYCLNLLRIGKYSKFHFFNVFRLEKIFSKKKILSDHQFIIFQYIQCVRFRFDSHLLVTYYI